MRPRSEIEKEAQFDKRIPAEEVLRNRLLMEVLLDIRDLMMTFEDQLSLLK